MPSALFFLRRTNDFARRVSTSVQARSLTWLIAIAALCVSGSVEGQDRREGRKRVDPVPATNSALRITASRTKGPAPLIVDFKAEVPPSYLTDNSRFTWDFGDGATGEGQVANHEYSQKGSYRVSVIYSGSFIDTVSSVTNWITITVQKEETDKTSIWKGLGDAIAEALANSPTNRPAPPRAMLQISPDQFVFSGEQGGTVPQPQVLTIRNTGKAPLRWREGPEASKWILLGLSHGTLASGASTELRVFVRDEALRVGTNQGKISIVSPEATNSPAVATVTVTLAAKPVQPPIAPPVVTNSTGTISVPTPNPPKNGWTDRWKDPVVWGFLAYVAGSHGYRIFKRRLIKIKPVLNPGAQRMNTPQNPLSLFLYVRIKMDSGSAHVSGKHPLISNPAPSGD